MNPDLLATRFDADRSHLRAVAYRLLGSASEAEDAVQEAWFRLEQSDADSISNLTGWLTTVVARICLDMLRSRKSRREDPLPEDMVELVDSDDPADEVVLTDAVADAMMAVLDHLSPGERVAFVLHDVFAVPFDEIAPILDRSPAAVRQNASRGRRRVRAIPEGHSSPNPDQRMRVVTAFQRASRAGDFRALLAVLDPEVVLRADAATLQIGARTGWLTSELEGPEAVAAQFDGKAQAAQLAIIDGEPGLVWAPHGTVRAVFRITVRDDRIVAINLSADPEVVARADVQLVE